MAARLGTAASPRAAAALLDDLAHLRLRRAVLAAAVDWLGVLVEVIGPAIEDRENKIASTPPVFAALGAIGHQLVEIADASERKEKARELAGSLSDVKWDRSRRWEGIALKYAAKGVFTVGGAKETACAV